MADLLPSERLQPCLLDRLTDQDPDQRKEGREQRVVSMRKYREAVLRDLGWVDEQDLFYRWAPGAPHNEAAWAARLLPALLDWFPGGA